MLTGQIMSRLYERLGGEAGLVLAVERFYSAVMADPLLAHFFDDVDMLRQRNHQFQFLKRLLGDGELAGVGMRAVHRRLVDEMGLNHVHFNAMVGHLETTLLELQMEPDDAEIMVARLEALRGDVLDL